jgi:hypothetical protein
MGTPAAPNDPVRRRQPTAARPDPVRRRSGGIRCPSGLRGHQKTRAAVV